MMNRFPEVLDTEEFIRISYDILNIMTETSGRPPPTIRHFVVCQDCRSWPMSNRILLATLTFLLY